MPVYSLEKLDRDSFLAIWEITETEDELINELSVPESELEDILLSPSPRRRVERLAVRALINKAFEKRQYLGYEENNRPFLKNYPGDISISHAGRFACIYVHNSMNVGVDLEPLWRNFYAVEAKVISDNEAAYLTDDNRQQQLCLIWCAKEAIYKAMLARGVDFLKHIEIKKFTPKQNGKLSAIFTQSNGSKVKLKLEYKFFEEHAIVWLNR